ncbi:MULTISPECIES: TetR/AcrR family transcriptional regulator [unclassified Paenibacillus]|uniref:TetR/AcrR family transcriptional regulator n=1 Tax=unclassified Paenibacillus TaxID=185978 RepID=UPI0007098D56|nr:MULTISPECIES: TetR/AcrR family transcriptional regulator [unclassified Paenibacillus]KQX68130.1 TetR family transcriptional regulator [Paenibacillus sp. Root444D2]KRE46515.1 TetR family transcriptional regulator [Paenibacillus sp. Soil724D2]
MARTKEFDEDAVLIKAMRLFWEQGYEKTSMMDLVSHMGVHKRSMYDSFGDKHSLYIKALKRYSEMIEQSVKRIINGTISAEEAIRLLLETTIRRDDDELPKGCLMVNTAVELAPHDSESRAWVNQSLTDFEQLIRELIEAGQQSGELDKTLNAEWLSCYFNNAFTGLRVLAKTTDDREKLMQIVETTMSVLKRK